MIKNHNDVIYSVIQRLVKHESSTTRIHWSVYCRLRRIASTVPDRFLLSARRFVVWSGHLRWITAQSAAVTRDLSVMIYLELSRANIFIGVPLKFRLDSR